MKKIFYVGILALLTASLTFAQDDKEQKDWMIKGITGLNASQTALSNWSAGGENTFTGNVYLNVQANYKKNRWSWDNALNTDFGKTYTKSNDWVKAVDKIELTSKLGYAFSKNWNIAFMGNFLTQYAPGYKDAADKKNGKPHISKFLSPGYLTLALGAEYKPCDDFSVLISPLTGKLTFVHDDYLSSIGAFGVNPGKHSLAELGASVVANLNKKFTENISYISKLTLFSAYNNNFGNVDMIWDNMLSMKVSKYLTTTLTLNMLYDDDIHAVDKDGKEIGPRLQIREMIGVGVAYNF